MEESARAPPRFSVVNSSAVQTTHTGGVMNKRKNEIEQLLRQAEVLVHGLQSIVNDLKGMSPKKDVFSKKKEGKIPHWQQKHTCPKCGKVGHGNRYLSIHVCRTSAPPHWATKHTCFKCGKQVRGNGFFSHFRVHKKRTAA